MSLFVYWRCSHCHLVIYKKYFSHSAQYLLGKKEDYSDHTAARWKNVFLLAFGQKKMFRNPLVAVIHFVIYAGFIIINIEVLEIFLDGVFGTHRLFAAPLGTYIQLADQRIRISGACRARCVCYFFMQKKYHQTKTIYQSRSRRMAAKRRQLYSHHRNHPDDVCS